MLLRRLTCSLTFAVTVMLSASAGAMTLPGSPPTTSPEAQANAAMLDEGTVAPKIENIYWCGRWACHPGWGWHRWGYHPWGWHPWGWGWHRWGWGWHRPWGWHRWGWGWHRPWGWHRW